MANDSREALIAHDADQLEMILALKEYKDLGNRYADEWYPFRCRRLQTEAAQSWRRRSGLPIRPAGGLTMIATGGLKESCQPRGWMNLTQS